MATCFSPTLMHKHFQGDHTYFKNLKSQQHVTLTKFNKSQPQMECKVCFQSFCNHFWMGKRPTWGWKCITIHFSNAITWKNISTEKCHWHKIPTIYIYKYACTYCITIYINICRIQTFKYMDKYCMNIREEINALYLFQAMSLLLGTLRIIDNYLRVIHAWKIL